MDIYLSVNNREQVIRLPVIPSAFTITKPHSNELFETADQGQLKKIGKIGLKSIAIESFFPIRDYPFLRDRTYKGFEYGFIIDKWVEAKLPIRLIITDTPINMVVCVDNFEYSIKSDGDLYYNLALSEFRLVNIG